MNQNDFPKGWNEDKVREVIAHYEGQSEEDAIREDEEGVEATEAIVRVPHDLLSKVRELIAKHQH